MSAMRFCFLTTFYPPYNFGGDGIGIRRLARGLADRGHHVTVVHDVDAFELMNGGPPPEPAANTFGVHVIPLRSGVGALSPLLTQQLGRPVINGNRLARILKDGRFDVVVFNNISLIGGPGLLSYAPEATTLYLAHEHWLVCPTHVLWRHDQTPCTERQCVRCTLGHKRPVQLWRFTDYLTRQLDHVDAFVAMSAFSRDKHREFGFPREMEVLPYFLPESEEPPREALPRPHARPYFLFVGRLERIKGLDDVIPVFDRYTDADLVVVGDGTHAPQLKEIAGQNRRVRFVGRLPERDLHAYYQHAIASLVPSTGYETFGITLIESFRMRTPVIARRIGPFPDIVYTAAAGDLFTSPDELELAMRRLQGNAAWRDELGARGYEAYRAHWSDRAVIPQFLDIVDRAAARRGLACAQS
jgi:glycosyltransferase involved in cell wall biosynthesis